jgi:galactokinase
MAEHVEPGDPGEIAAALAARLSDPLGVFAAPGRVNLIGEHTDYNAGLCLPIALPHATYTAVALRDDERLTVASAQQHDRFDRRLADVAPGSVDGWVAYVAGVAWALREAGHDLPGMDLVVDGRVPLGSGLSSSAALICSAALAMCAAAGVDLDRRDLVAATMRAESEVAGAPTGGLDQTVALLGEAGHALLIDFRSHATRTVPWRPLGARLELLVVDTRASHAHSGGGYGSRREECEAAARALGVASLREADTSDLDRLDDDVLRRRVRHVVTEVDRVAATVDALAVDDWGRVGDLFTASHASMRDDFEISCAELDVVVDTALAHGALGARMTGGGFGGSAIALVPADRAGDLADRVAAAFADRGWGAPGVLPAPASAGAHEVALPHPRGSAPAPSR